MFIYRFWYIGATFQPNELGNHPAVCAVRFCFCVAILVNQPVVAAGVFVDIGRDVDHIKIMMPWRWTGRCTTNLTCDMVNYGDGWSYWWQFDDHVSPASQVADCKVWGNIRACFARELSLKMSLWARLSPSDVPTFRTEAWNSRHDRRLTLPQKQKSSRKECPFSREEAENHWLMANLESETEMALRHYRLGSEWNAMRLMIT